MTSCVTPDEQFHFHQHRRDSLARRLVTAYSRRAEKASYHDVARAIIATGASTNQPTNNEQGNEATHRPKDSGGVPRFHGYMFSIDCYSTVVRALPSSMSEARDSRLALDGTRSSLASCTCPRGWDRPPRTSMSPNVVAPYSGSFVSVSNTKSTATASRMVVGR